MRPRCAQPSETVSSAALPHHIARVDHYCLALTLGYGPFRTLMNSTYSTAMSTVPGAHPMSGANVDFALTVSLSIITVCIGCGKHVAAEPYAAARRHRVDPGARGYQSLLGDRGRSQWRERPGWACSCPPYTA